MFLVLTAARLMHRHLLPEINRIFRSHRFHDMTGRRQSRPAAIAILPTIDHNGRAPEPISPGRCTVFPLSTGCFNQNLHSGDAQPASPCSPADVGPLASRPSEPAWSRIINHVPRQNTPSVWLLVTSGTSEEGRRPINRAT